MSKNPNVYILTSSFAHQLKLAGTEAECAQTSENKKYKNAKFKKLRKEKKLLMANLDKEATDLEKYMKAMGGITLELDDRIKDDAEDMKSDESDVESESSFENCDNYNFSLGPKKAPKTGDELRQQRIEIEACGTIDYSKSVLSPNNKSKSKLLRPNIEKGPEEDLLTLGEGKALAKETMKSMGFKVSPSQPVTPGDGNCFCHALVNQLSYDKFLANLFTHETIRSYVVLNAEIIVKTNALELPPCTDKNDKSKNPKILPFDMKGWKNLMVEDGEYCDHLFIQLASEILNRKFVLVPVHYECGYGKGIIEIDPLKQPIGDPLYFLYYTESK